MPQVTNVDFLDKEFVKRLRDPKSADHSMIRDFVLSLAVCHNIICTEKNGKIIYDASSPDELALVNFAKFVGLEFKGIDEKQRILVFDHMANTTLSFELLHTLEFNSTRKRMSVIIKENSKSSSKYIIYCKGADSVILKKMEDKR